MRTKTIRFDYSRLTFCSWLSSVISLIIGALVLLGWRLDIAVFKSVVPDFVTMKVNTAICFMLAGGSLWLLLPTSLTPKRRRLALFSAGLVFLISLLTMLEYVLPWNFGIDELVWKQPAEALVSAAPGRMAFVTALTLFLLGSALLLLGLDKWRGVAGAQIIAFGTAIIPFIGLIGYIYNVQPLYQLSAYFSMALHTAVTAELLCFGILLARPDQALMRSLTSPHSGGVMMRRLLPFVILMPIIIGWLRLLGQQAGYYDTTFGVILLVVAFVVSFLVTLWVHAHLLNQLDASRAEAEQALRESEERLRLATEATQMGTWDLDLTSSNLYWSPGMERLMGFAPGSFSGTYEDFAQLIHPDDRARFAAAQQHALGNEGHYLAELRFILPDGRTRWGLGCGQMIFDERGSPVRIVGIDLDISERKRAEAEIQQLNDDLEKRVAQRTEELAAANREMEAFSYSVSHDLRAPLRAIDGFSRILVEEYGPQLSPEAGDYLQIVRENTQQMGKLIDDLLSFAHLNRQSCNKQVVAPALLVRQVLAQLQHEQAGRRVEISLDDLPDCQADQALLKQVFMNLLSNALKFTSRCDIAIIQVGCLSAEPPGTAPIYFVKDNGVGFDMKYAHKLFNVFQRLHRAEDYEGTGVGLATVQRIIQRHGGRIWAEAALNQGTTFFFTLEGATSA